MPSPDSLVDVKYALTQFDALIINGGIPCIESKYSDMEHFYNNITCYFSKIQFCFLFYHKLVLFPP